MAAGTQTAVADDQGWQDYTPPKPKTATAAPAAAEGEWQDYQPNAAAKPAAPGPTPGLEPRAKAMVSSGQVPPPSPKTQFEKERPGRTSNQGFWSEYGPGLKNFASGVGEMLDPTRGLSGAGLTAVGLNPREGTVGERLNEVPAVQAYHAGKVGYERGKQDEATHDMGATEGARYWEAGTGAAGALVPGGMDAERAREHANRGEEAAIYGQAAVPLTVLAGNELAKPVAKVTKGVREGIGDYVRDPATGELKPNAKVAAQTAGAIGGGLATTAMYKSPWYGGVAGYRLGPSLMEAMFPESEARAGARHGEAVAAETEAKMKTIEDARQKELADQERLKEQDAQSRVRRGREQERLDKQAAANQPPAPLFPGASGTAGPSPVGAAPVAPAELPPIPQGNPTPFPTVKTRGQVAAETRATQPRIVNPSDYPRETPRTGNEGRAATWTNQRLYDMVQDPAVPYEDKRLAVAQMSLRQLPLPENARYLMGDPNAARAVLNPKEVTRFTPEGVPIREMNNPEMASRERIWTPESQSPPRGTPPYDPGRIIKEKTVGGTAVGAPETIGSRIGKGISAAGTEAATKGTSPADAAQALRVETDELKARQRTGKGTPEEQATLGDRIGKNEQLIREYDAAANATKKLVAPKARTPVKPILKDIGLELRGEFPEGYYDFRDNRTGGTVAIKKEGFSEAALREKVAKHRESIRNNPTAEPQSDLAQEKATNAQRRAADDEATQAAGAETASIRRSGVEEGARTKPTEELANEEAAAAKPGRVQEEFSPEELANAEGRLREEVGMMSSMDRPGVYFDEWGENAPTAAGRSGMGGGKKGVRAGGSWRGVQSGRGMMPFMSEHPEFTPSAIEKALEKDGDNPTYQKVIRAAAEFNKNKGTGTTIGEPIGKPENYEDEERAAMREENWGEATEPETQPIGERMGENTAERERTIAEGEGVLPGMGEHIAKHAESAAKVKGEELTREANTPKNIDKQAGLMETHSPLFRGTEASPQNEMFRPGGEAPAAKSTDAGVRRSFLSTQGAEERMRPLIENGATDQEILDFAGKELGRGGGTSDQGMYDYYGGKTPKVEVTTGGTKQVFKGKDLADAVRRIFGIPQPGKT